MIQALSEEGFFPTRKDICVEVQPFRIYVPALDMAFPLGTTIPEIKRSLSEQYERLKMKAGAAEEMSDSERRMFGIFCEHLDLNQMLEQRIKERPLSGVAQIVVEKGERYLCYPGGVRYCLSELDPKLNEQLSVVQSNQWFEADFIGGVDGFPHEVKHIVPKPDYVPELSDEDLELFGL